jgi:hypothetical protein
MGTTRDVSLQCSDWVPGVPGPGCSSVGEITFSPTGKVKGGDSSYLLLLLVLVPW